MIVPRLNLLDPDVEPLDEELDALMRDVHRKAIERRELTHRAFMQDLQFSITRCAIQQRQRTNYK